MNTEIIQNIVLHLTQTSEPFREMLAECKTREEMAQKACLAVSLMIGEGKIVIK